MSHLLFTYWSVTTWSYLDTGPDFPFVTSRRLLPMTFFFTKCLKTVSRIFFSIIFPRIKVKHLNLQFLRSHLLPFLKSVVTFAFFQSSGTSSNHHDLPKMIMKSGLAVTASSLNTCRCIPSGSMDLCIFSLFKCSFLLRLFFLKSPYPSIAALQS